MNRLPSDVDMSATLKASFKVPTLFKPDGTPYVEETVNSTKTLGMTGRRRITKPQVFDPSLPNSIVLWDPKLNQQLHQEKQLKEKKTLAEILGIKRDVRQPVHVVVDPTLAKVLRPHQIDGVRFLYNCVTGMLQCITLLWTLLKQSPVAGKPTIEKAIIACPSPLVKNWASEFVKWIGSTRVDPLVIDSGFTKDKAKIVKQWGAKDTSLNPILIISYESLRLYSRYLGNAQIGLLVCDEGHRLKSEGSLLYKELNSLRVKRRVVVEDELCGKSTSLVQNISQWRHIRDSQQ
ncbi:P-loop containing nucleoside triphosphate hydrolase protein [Pilobolus umbonatus]|nr:P-loop containing nucleoside triphosphate hydrolase protein [Pilobolus umbonatus]KAI8970622.1 P-loop containing nucleoside triphosphate hydrolase protein [Pilobolus umbonatus]